MEAPLLDDCSESLKGDGATSLVTEVPLTGEEEVFDGLTSRNCLMENLYSSRAKGLPVLSRRPVRQEVPPVVSRPCRSVRFVFFRVRLDV